MLYNIVDRIYIGHIPGDGALALTGIGVCMPLIMIVTAFANLISTGGAPRASIYMGKDDIDYSEKILGNCFVLQIIISIILTTVLLIWNENILLAFGASENTIPYATAYMNIYAMGTIFVQLTIGMNAFITAQGYTKISMRSVMIGAISNIILDPIFIFGFNMGVRGAALATIVAQAFSCISVLSFLFGKKTMLKLKKINMRLNSKIVIPCLTLGSAAFVMQASESVVSICFNSSLLHYGGDIAVGAMTILSSIMTFANLPLMGLGQGAQPIISFNYGARNPKRVKDTFKILLTVSFIYSTALWVAIMLKPDLFARIFSSDSQLVAFTSTALRIYNATLFLYGIQIACQLTFTALGSAKNSITVAIVRKFVLLVPLIYIMPYIVSNPTNGIYMAESISTVLAVIFTSILFTHQFKQSMLELEC